jgi:hypothetical protein
MSTSARNQYLEGFAVDGDFADHHAIEILCGYIRAEDIADLDDHTCLATRPCRASFSARALLAHWAVQAALAPGTCLTAFTARTWLSVIALRTHRTAFAARAGLTGLTAGTGFAPHADLAGLSLRSALALDTGQAIAAVTADRAFGPRFACDALITRGATLAGRTDLAARTSWPGFAALTRGPSFTWLTLRTRLSTFALRTDLSTLTGRPGLAG